MLGTLSFAQSLNIAEDEPVPAIGGSQADIFESIPNTDVDRIYKDRLDKGILIPEFGIEDIFMVKAAKERLDLEKFGFTCIHSTESNIISSSDPPSTDPKEPRKVRNIVAVGEGTTMLIVKERAPGQSECKTGGQEGRLLKVYRVTVTSKDLMQTLLELRALMGGIEGIKNSNCRNQDHP